MSSRQKSHRRETVDVKKIYDHVKSRKFLEQLCMECIQDVKQKPAYQSLKGMVDSLLRNAMENVGSPNTDAERITNMRMQVAECGMLAYTIDCVVAEVVCNKLEKEYFGMVKELACDLSKTHNMDVNDDTSPIHDANSKNEMRVSNNINLAGSSKNNSQLSPRSMTRNATVKSPSKSPSKVMGSGINGAISSPAKSKSSYIAQKVERPATRNYAVEKKVGNDTKSKATEFENRDNHNESQRNHSLDIVISKDACHNASGRQVSNISITRSTCMDHSPKHGNNATHNASVPQNVVEVISSPNKPNKFVVVATHGNAIIKHVVSHDHAKDNFPATVSSSSLPMQCSTVESTTSKKLQQIVLKKEEDSNPMTLSTENTKDTVSGYASSKSDCEQAFSVGSVSPVHTSDLSSFDDLISLSEDDEQGKLSKKKIRLKDANDIFLNGKLPELFRKKKRGRAKVPQKAKSSSPSKNAPAEQSSSSSEDESVETTPRKSLPQRKRKPNSKYASDIYNCNLNNFPQDNSDSNAGKLPPHNRTEPMLNKKQTYNPASEDILSIETHSALVNQSNDKHVAFKSVVAEKSITPSKADDSTMRSPQESPQRKRGRPRKVTGFRNVTPQGSKAMDSDSLISYGGLKKLKYGYSNSQSRTTHSPYK